MIEANGIIPNSFCEASVILIPKQDKDITRKIYYKLPLS
jgi:hypothetical protein